MQRYEYKVVPAPEKGEKARGVKGTPARFAHRLSRLMNELAREGWEYMRADTLPCEERTGLTGKTLTYQNMLVFRRETPQALPIFDQTTVPGAALAGSAAPGALMAAAVSATPAQDAAPEDTAAAAEGAAETAPEAAPAGPEKGAALSARAPKGKTPRLSAFDRLDDTAEADGPPPGTTAARR